MCSEGHKNVFSTKSHFLMTVDYNIQVYAHKCKKQL